MRIEAQQLRARRDELAARLATAPATAPAATLRQVAEHIDDVIRSGTSNQRKALIEALIARINITGPDRIIPVFRIPQPAAPLEDRTPHPAAAPNGHATYTVRAMTNLVGLTCQHPNSPASLLADGPEVAIRPVRARRLDG